MKRFLLAAAVMAAAVLGSSVTLHSTTPFPATPGCPHNDNHVAVCYDLQLYYNAIEQNILGAAEATPEDKFFATPPGIAKPVASAEQLSIGNEVEHATEIQSRMCTLLGYHNPNFEWEKQWDHDPSRIVAIGKYTTKAEAIDALKRSFAECDPYFKNLTEATLGKIVTGNHGPKPLATTLFNVISHDREVYGRMVTFLATEGIKASGGETQALTPKQKAIEDAAAAAARANRSAGGNQ